MNALLTSTTAPDVKAPTGHWPKDPWWPWTNQKCCNHRKIVMLQLSQKRTAQGTGLQGVEVLQPINPGPALNNPQLLSTDGLSCQVSPSLPCHCLGRLGFLTANRAVHQWLRVNQWDAGATGNSSPSRSLSGSFLCWCDSWEHSQRRIPQIKYVWGIPRMREWKPSFYIRGGICSVRKITSKAMCTLSPHIHS